MKRLWTAALLALNSLVFIACTTTPKPLEVRQPYLWQFSKVGGPRSFLFGTMHVDTDMETFPPTIKEKVQEAHITMVETGKNQTDHTYFDALVLLPPSDQLSNHVSAKAYEWIKNEVSELVSEATLQRLTSYGAIWLLDIAQGDLKPWEGMIPFQNPQAVAVAINPDSYNSPAVMDDEIENYANAHRKVEYLDEQRQLEEVTKAYVHTMYNDEVLEHWAWGQVPTRIRAMPNVDSSAYEDGNFKALEAEREDVMKAEPALYRLLLDQRNLKWLPKILAHTKKKQSVFVAVGCLHMVGPYGLIRLLEKEGYRVERIQLQRK